MPQRTCKHDQDEAGISLGVQSRRCLVPADGYYEWLREGKEKLPYLYEFDGGKLFSLAGLWESWKDPAVADAEVLQTCTLITTEANSLAAEVHDRMPVIVHPEDRSFPIRLLGCRRGM